MTSGGGKQFLKGGDQKKWDIVLSTRLGEGSFGQVFLGTQKSDNKQYAVKVIDLDEEDLEELQQEIRFLSELKSPFVVEYFGWYLKDDKLHIVMEYIGSGSILEQVQIGTLSEIQIAAIAGEVLKALQFLHVDGKIHRDIKAANVLLGTDCAVKLADFGVSGTLQNGVKRFTRVGSPYWMAPEVITEAGTDQKADIWSLGITCFEMTRGLPPYAELNPMHAVLKIPTAEPPKLETQYSSDFRNFVSQCLTKDPEKRPSATQLLQHPFITQVKDRTALLPLVTRYSQYKQKNAKPFKSTLVLKKAVSKHKRRAQNQEGDEEKSDQGSYASASLPPILNDVVDSSIRRLKQSYKGEPVVLSLNEIKSAFIGVEKKAPGVTMNFLKSLVGYLEKTKGASKALKDIEPVSGNNANQSFVSQFLINRWQKTMFKEEEWSKYQHYLSLEPVDT